MTHSKAILAALLLSPLFATHKTTMCMDQSPKPINAKLELCLQNVVYSPFPSKHSEIHIAFEGDKMYLNDPLVMTKVILDNDTVKKALMPARHFIGLTDGSPIKFLMIDKNKPENKTLVTAACQPNKETSLMSAHFSDEFGCLMSNFYRELCVLDVADIPTLLQGGIIRTTAKITDIQNQHISLIHAHGKQGCPNKEKFMEFIEKCRANKPHNSNNELIDESCSIALEATITPSTINGGLFEVLLTKFLAKMAAEGVTEKPLTIRELIEQFIQ